MQVAYFLQFPREPYNFWKNITSVLAGRKIWLIRIHLKIKFLFLPPSNNQNIVIKLLAVNVQCQDTWLNHTSVKHLNELEVYGTLPCTNGRDRYTQEPGANRQANAGFLCVLTGSVALSEGWTLFRGSSRSLGLSLWFNKWGQLSSINGVRERTCLKMEENGDTNQTKGLPTMFWVQSHRGPAQPCGCIWLVYWTDPSLHTSQDKPIKNFGT